MASSSREIDFLVLGPVAMTREGAELALGGRRQRLVLALLVLNAGRTVLAERLIDQVWGEALPAGHTGPLRNHIWQLRRLLGTNGAGHIDAGASPLASQPGGYRPISPRMTVLSICQALRRDASNESSASAASASASSGSAFSSNQASASARPSA